MAKLSAWLDAQKVPRSTLAALLAVALAPAVLLCVCAVSRRWMDDDAFINLRVVRHVLEGNGPVFNIGDRVEVYTSALWLFILTFLGAIGARLEVAAVWTGIVFSVVGLLLAQLACMIVERDDGTSPARAERIPLPLGALVIASIPVMWDYASGGLETGLTFLWLGGSFFAVVRVVDKRPVALRPWIVAAVIAGLGPLVRPELALYTAGFLLSLYAGLKPETDTPEEKAALRRRTIRVVLAAVALPLAYEIFRMGYFAALTPNTAIAKEAFRWNWRQGTCYAKNFFGLYKLMPPLTALGILWYLRARSLSDRGDRLSAVMTAPVFIGSFHGFYVVLMGGDYMHGRMFLPCVFAAAMPVAMVVIRPSEKDDRRGFAVRLAGALVIILWAPVCAGFLRVDRENVCYIGDERGWYARIAQVPNPILIADYRQHHFGHQADNLIARVQAKCPDGAPPAEPGCRLVHIGDETEYGVLSRIAYPMADSVDPRIRGIVGATAVGIVGYRLPSNIHVADHHGLGDPIGSRIALAGRGRPGHEKQLSNAWVVARFSKAEGTDDASVRDARAALGCSPLADLERATRAPLTLGRFFSNMTGAFTFQRLRIPADPTDAAEKLCGIRPPPQVVGGGDGGAPYRWRCPEHLALGSVVVTLAESEPAFASIEARCRAAVAEGGSAAGPPIGTKGNRAFDIVCPPGTVAIGFHGHADTVVREVGLVCAALSAPRTGELLRTRAVGKAQGDPFQILCPEATVGIGLAGRIGALVDAVGAQCGAP